MKKNKLAVITIHKGDIKNLIKTINSIDKQLVFPDLHLILIHHSTSVDIKIKKKKNRKILISKDRSLYQAMNIALKKTFNYSVIFINSGDELSNKRSIKKIISKLSTNKCLIFKTKILHGKTQFIPRTSYFMNENYMPHPSFIRPPVIKNKKILMNEKYKIAADGLWMKQNISIFGKKKFPDVITNFYTGGLSTNPSLRSIKLQIEFSYKEGLKELIKFILSKIFREKYFQIIYVWKFYKK